MIKLMGQHNENVLAAIAVATWWDLLHRAMRARGEVFTGNV